MRSDKASCIFHNCRFPSYSASRMQLYFLLILSIWYRQRSHFQWFFSTFPIAEPSMNMINHVPQSLHPWVSQNHMHVNPSFNQICLCSSIRLLATYIFTSMKQQAIQNFMCSPWQRATCISQQFHQTWFILHHLSCQISILDQIAQCSGAHKCLKLSDWHAWQDHTYSDNGPLWFSFSSTFPDHHIPYSEYLYSCDSIGTS